MTSEGKVVWRQGMFLQPQHFQQQDRYFEAFTHESTQGLATYPWGFVRLVVNTEELKLGRLQIDRAAGRFQDGTPFDWPDHDQPPEPVLIAEEVRSCRYFLALPKKRSDAAQVGNEELDRYAEKSSRVRDVAPLQTGDTKASSDSRDIEVATARLRLQLLPESRATGQYHLLGVARVIERRGDVVELDERHVPPALDFAASSALRKGVGDLHGLVNQRAAQLIERVANRPRLTSEQLHYFLMLAVINRLQPLLAHIDFPQPLHPERLFADLLQYDGELATYVAREQRPEKHVPYTHGDAQPAFEWLFRSLHERLTSVLESRATPIEFAEVVRQDLGNRPVWVSPQLSSEVIDDTDLVFVIKSKLPPHETSSRFASAAWLGPRRIATMQFMIKQAVRGVSLTPLPTAPVDIRHDPGSVYFSIDRASNAKTWDEARASGGLALYAADQNTTLPGFSVMCWSIRKTGDTA